MKRPNLFIIFIIATMMAFSGSMVSVGETRFAPSQNPDPATSPTEIDWVQRAIQAADSLLPLRGALVLEGKIALINLQELRTLKNEVWKKGDEGLKREYLQLEEQFINIIRRVELAQLVQFNLDDWKNLAQSYELERDSLLQHINSLTDSLIISYAPLFSSPKGQNLLRKVEQRDKLMVDYYYRMGVLFLEYAELKYFRETEAWDNMVDSVSKLPDSVKFIAEEQLPPEPKKDYSQASEKFQFVLGEFPSSEYADDALYNLGYIGTNSQDDLLYAEGINLFNDFIVKYPQSEYYPEVQFRLGEYYFHPLVNSLAEAIEHYKVVLNYPNCSQYYNAVYRLGLCYYQSNDFPGAIKYLTQTIDNSISELERGRFSNLMEESIDNLSKSFASDPRIAGLGVKPAVEYLNQNPKRLTLFGARMLKRIGDIYQNDYGNYQEAATTFDTLLIMFANDPDAPDINKKLLKCYDLLGDKDKVNKEKYRIFERYNHNGTWAQAQTDPKLVKDADLLAEKNLREILRESTVLSNESKQRDDFLHTIDLCRTYIKFYPNTTETYRINYNLAVILTLDLKDYLPACAENLYLTRSYPSGKYHELCAVNAVECARLLMEQQAADTTLQFPPAGDYYKSVPEEVIKRIPYLGDNPLSTGEILYLVSIQNYIDLYPQGEKSDIYTYNAGVLYFKHEKYNASRICFQTLINDYPASPKREEAYKYIMEGYFAAQDFGNCERMAKMIIAGGFGKEITDLAKIRVGESIYSNAKSLAASQDFIRAGSEYKRVALETPDYEFADNALWESHMQFKQGAAYDSAIVSLELLVQKAPKSEWADKSLNNIAFIYLNNFNDKRKAADIFEKLFDQYPKSEYAKNALSNASVNYSLIEAYNDALRVNEKYLKAYPEAEDAIEVQYENANLYLKMGQLDKAIASFTTFTKKYPDDPRNIRASYEVGNYYLTKGDLVQAKNYFDQTLKSHRSALAKGKEGFPRYASIALSTMLDWKVKDFFKIEYSPLSAISSNRTQKTNLKKEMETGYKELITFRQKEALTAYYNLCRLDEDMARVEFHQAMPQLTGDALANKRNALLDTSIVLYVNAAQSYYGAKTELKNWEDALTKQRSDLMNKLSATEALQASQGFLPPDSQRVYEADKKLLEDVDASLNLSRKIQDDCAQKIAGIYLNNARSVTEIYDRMLIIPTQGKGYQEKIFFRESVIEQAIMPAALNLIDLYRQAYANAVVAGANKAWCDSTHNEINAIMKQIVSEYDDVIDQALSRYKINLGSFRQKVTDVDYAALDIFDAPSTYLDIAKSVVDSMMISLDKFLTLAHSDTFKAISLPYMDSLYTGVAWRFNQLYSDYIKDNNDQYAKFDKKFGQTAEDLFVDGMDNCETIAGDANDYRMANLELSIANIEKYAISTPAGDNLIRSAVKLDPFTYGHLLGLSIETMSVTGSTDWKVSADAPAGFEAPTFNDLDWAYAVLMPPPAPQIQDTIPLGYKYTDSVAVDTSLNIPLKTVVIDTTLKFPIDSTAKDTVIIIPGGTVQVDTVFYLPGETRAVDTTLYRPGGTQLVDTTMYVSADSIPVDTVIAVEMDSTAYDTTILITGDSIRVDTTITITQPDIRKDTTIYVVRWQEIDTTYTQVLEWRTLDTTFYHYTDSVAIMPEPPLDFSRLDAIGIKPIWAASPANKLCFRYKFNLPSKPIYSSVIISADENFTLNLNGKFVAEGSSEKNAWLEPLNMSVVKLLNVGENTIAVAATDADLSAHGLWFKLDYNLMPENIDNIPIVLTPSARVEAPKPEPETINQTEQQTPPDENKTDINQ